MILSWVLRVDYRLSSTLSSCSLVIILQFNLIILPFECLKLQTFSTEDVCTFKQRDVFSLEYR